MPDITAVTMSSQQELQDSPTDAITSVKWSRDGKALLVGSWDSRARIYRKSDDNSFSLEVRDDTFQGPCLDVCWGRDGEDLAYVVGLHGEVLRYSLSGGDISTMSAHDQPSNKVAFSPEHNVLISTSWDGTMHVHDPDSKAYVRLKLAAKPFALCLTSERLVVAMAERKVSVYELQRLRQLVDESGSTKTDQQMLEEKPWQERESSLKFMARDVAALPDGSGFATSSIEGRVGVERFDPDRQKDTYAFKCHRQTQITKDEEGNDIDVDVVYPVNAIAFHPTLSTFATGGGDGVVSMWDAVTKRRVKMYQALPASVAALDFSPDGKSLAIGVCPGFEDGKEDMDVDSSLVKVFVRHMADGETKVKEKKEK